MKVVHIILLSIVLISVITFSYRKSFEGFSLNDTSCPNLLIKKGNKYHLLNSSKAKVPGVNPVEFNSLEEYTEFIEWYKSQGIHCPVLYLQEEYDAQGDQVFAMRPSPNSLCGGAQTKPVNSLKDIRVLTETDLIFKEDMKKREQAAVDLALNPNTPLNRALNQPGGSAPVKR